MNRFPGTTYQLDAESLRILWRLSERLNDGTVLSADQRRDIAQAIQYQLNSAEVVT